MATATKKKKPAKKSAPPPDAEAVRDSAANREASRAGTSQVRTAPASEDGRLAGFKVEVIDNARAIVSLGKESTEPLDQSDVHTLIKLLSQTAQEIY